MNQAEELARSQRENEMLTADNERLMGEVRELKLKYEDMRASLSWKLTAPLRLLLNILWGKKSEPKMGALELTEENYRKWLGLFDKLTESDRVTIREAIGKMAAKPQFSLLLVLNDAGEADLRRTLESMRRQLYKNWELCVVDDGSVAPHVARTLASFGDDPRVRIARMEQTLGRAGAAREAVSMARGQYAGFVDPGDQLAETALFEMAVEANSHADVAVIYCDEDSLDEGGERGNPRFKTDWNPDLLSEQNYLGRMVFYERSLISGMGDLSAEHELALRATAGLVESRVRHVAAVLCHRPAARKPAVFPHVKAPESRASVTVIIPTRDRADLLDRCLEGLLNRTKYQTMEVIIVDNASKEEKTLRLFEKYKESGKVRVMPYAGEFNWSAMNNAAAKASGSDLLLFLNNDTDVMGDWWLQEMAAEAMRSEVGAVGAKLLFANGTVQHAGVWLGPKAHARHGLRLSKQDDAGYLECLSTKRNVSAVTGACLAMRRAVFEEMKGFDETYPVSYSDLDICLRLIERGYRIVWTPRAELRHLESASRGSSEWRWRKEEADYRRFWDKWEKEMRNDFYFNPNLDWIGEEKIALAFPPRRKQSWQSQTADER